MGISALPLTYALKSREGMAHIFAVSVPSFRDPLPGKHTRKVCIQRRRKVHRNNEKIHYMQAHDIDAVSPQAGVVLPP